MKDPFAGGSRDIEWQEMMRQWVDETLPGTRMELMEPSEYSGFIRGGPIGLRLDFSPEGLRQFEARWEDGSGTGKSVDERFQCYLYPYDRWFEEHDRFVPARERPQGLGVTRWWCTPAGFIYHQIDAAEVAEHKIHPASARDIWMRVPELFPELAGLDTDKLTHGDIQHSAEDGKWYATYTLPFSRGELDEPYSIPTEKQMREWFNLPEDAVVMEDEW